MIASTVLERGRAGLLALLVALSLVVTAIPASAGPYTSRGAPFGWDFIDASGLTWERTPKNITWEGLKPGNITWEKLDPNFINALRNITWD